MLQVSKNTSKLFLLQLLFIIQKIISHSLSVSDFGEIKRGHFRNGVRNGLHITADVEVYEYNYYMRAAKGINLALADSRDRPIIRQNGRQQVKRFFVLGNELTCRSVHLTRKGDPPITQDICHECNIRCDDIL